jgi:nucleoid DNA-binding protein
MTMNTTDLIYEIARRTKHTHRPLTRDDVTAVVDLLLDLMTEELTQSQGEIRLKGIGILKVKQAKRSGGKLKTGQALPQIQKQHNGHYYRLTLTASRSLLQHLRKLE